MKNMNRKYIIDKFVEKKGMLKPEDFKEEDINVLLRLISNYFEDHEVQPPESKLPVYQFEGNWFLQGGDCKECGKFFFNDRPYPHDTCESCTLKPLAEWAEESREAEKHCECCNTLFRPEKPIFAICNVCAEEMDEMFGYPEK
jgi:hypothetical protein